MTKAKPWQVITSIVVNLMIIAILTIIISIFLLHLQHMIISPQLRPIIEIEKPPSLMSTMQVLTVTNFNPLFEYYQKIIELFEKYPNILKFGTVIAIPTYFYAILSLPYSKIQSNNI